MRDEPRTSGLIDASRRSFVPVPAGSDFPLQNLPAGVFSDARGGPRVGVAIGAHVLDLAAVAASGLLDGVVDDPVGLCAAPDLRPLLSRDRPTWRALRARVADLLDERAEPATRPTLEAALVPASDVTLHLPVVPGDYVDFYSSIEHATNIGRLFRPDDEPLLPNWRHLPVGYHGRASTVVVSGTPVVRPRGQRRGADGAPVFGPTERLDIELEVGFLTGGPPNRSGEPIAADAADTHVFGFVLVNDWSARDIQAWEYQPLGPFLGKSFATTVSPWVVPLDALAPFRVPPPPQDPEPLPYLRTRGEHALDLQLEVELTPAGDRPHTISRVDLRRLYWTYAQQLAHVTVNGTSIRPGDLYASGTVSGDTPGSQGSLIELTADGREPLALDGVERTFLEDGDRVTLRGYAGGAGTGHPRIGFGPCTATVVPPPPDV